MLRLATAIALWFWLMVAAVLGVQNPQLVNVQGLGGRSPALPLGLVLVFMAGWGGTIAFAWPGGRRWPPASPRRARTKRPGNPAPHRDWETEKEETW